jgi:hypothetical protein
MWRGLFPSALKEAVKRRVQLVQERVTLCEHVYADDEVGAGVDEFRVLEMPARVPIASPADDPFVPLAKYYREGHFTRPPIFIAKMSNVCMHVPSGLVCTRDLKAVIDRGHEDRRTAFAVFGELKPLYIKQRLRGVFTTVHGSGARNFWHWLADYLPRIYTLERALPDRPITVVMPASLPATQRESLACVLPPSFRALYLDAGWVRLEHFWWASMVSGRCNGLLPQAYFDFIRRRIFAHYGLPPVHQPTHRLYITRSGAKWRRIRNEAETRALLEGFGFVTVELGRMSLAEQVALFHSADVVVGPHGAGLGATVFGGPLRVVVLYATRVPPNYFHTMAKGLGQRHYFVLHDEASEDADFTLDLPALRRVLVDEIGLTPLA